MRGQKSFWRHAVPIEVSTAVFVLIASSQSSLWASEDIVRISTWGGSYGDAINDVVAASFEENTGIAVEISFSQDYEILAKLRGSGGDIADVISMTLETAELACRDGLIAPLNHDDILGRETDQFLPGTLQECAIGDLLFAQSLFFNPQKFSSEAPTTVADVFDVKRFPGVRILPKSSKYLFIWALLAEGVPGSEVHSALRTRDGSSIALERLWSLMPSIVWADNSSTALRMFEAEDAAFVGTWNSAAVEAVREGQVTIDVIKGSQIWSSDAWTIPANTENQERAQKFIAFATHRDSLTRLAERLLVGPARLDANPEFSGNISGLLSLPKNLNEAVRLDDQFWVEEGTRFEQVWKGYTANGGGGGETGGGGGETGGGGGGNGGRGGETAGGGGGVEPDNGGSNGGGWAGSEPSQLATRRLMINGREPEEEVHLAGAFGMVAFTSRPVAQTRQRFELVCELFNSQFATAEEAEAMNVPMSRRIITFWPVQNASAQKSWISECDKMVTYYDVNAAKNAVDIAEQVAQGGDINIRIPMWTRRGPFLIAWSPPLVPVSDRIFLVMDLSGMDSFDDLAEAFRTYRDRVERNPDIWNDQNQFSADNIRKALRDFLNRYGAPVADVFGKFAGAD